MKNVCIVFALLWLCWCADAWADDLRLCVSDVEGEAQLLTDWSAFRDSLQRVTGLDITLVPMFSRVDPADSLRDEKVDIILAGPSEYVIITKKTEARPVVGFSRPDYYAVIVVLATSSIFDPARLKGRKVGFGARGSTSSHLAPMQILADNGIDPRTEIRAVHLQLEKAWESLKRGSLAAVGFSHDEFMRLRQLDSLPPGSFRVIARGGDLPNDLLMAGDHVDEPVFQKLCEAFRKNEQGLMSAVLQGPGNEKYSGSVFLHGVQDGDYDSIRRMYRTIGYPAFAD